MMIDKDKSAQDRPFLSAPGKAITAMVLFYLLWPLLVPNTASAIGGLIGNDEPVGHYFLILLAIAAIPVLLILFAIRRGTVKGIRLMWWFGYASIALLAFDALVGALMTFGVAGGGTRHDQLAGQFLLMASAVLGLLWFILFRTMRSVRWLDPNSTPDEWERKMAVGAPRRR